MRVSQELSEFLSQNLTELQNRFLLEKQLLSEPDALLSKRFLRRSILPHILKLSDFFNRKSEAKPQGSGLSDSNYWKISSNPQNLRLAYFTYYMPMNLYRVAAVWSELLRLGFQPPFKNKLRGVEWGSGPAPALPGVMMASHLAGLELGQINWSLIEQDLSFLKLGKEWVDFFISAYDLGSADMSTFQRSFKTDEHMFAKNSAEFNLWVFCYFLNELHTPPDELARFLYRSFDHHLEEGGVVIMVEPALKTESRKLLELRKNLVELFEQNPRSGLKVLLPCLGHQACGALVSADDWCHEEVMWWRPPHIKTLDELSGLDHKSLPFSYLVITKNKAPIEEILPDLKGHSQNRYRLVSAARKTKPDYEFFICGQDGKKRARIHQSLIDQALERGDILSGVESTGNPESLRIQKLTKTE